jgi:hypothetical protein
MDENRSDTPEQVVKFLPKEQPRSHGTPAEEAGQAIIAKIRKAINVASKWMIANITSDDALILPHHANPAGLNFRERQGNGPHSQRVTSGWDWPETN